TPYVSGSDLKTDAKWPRRWRASAIVVPVDVLASLFNRCDGQFAVGLGPGDLNVLASHSRYFVLIGDLDDFSVSSYDDSGGSTTDAGLSASSVTGARLAA